MRTVELPEFDPKRALDDRPVPAFLQLTFEEALSLFLDRRMMTPEAFEALSDAEKARAFTATRLASDALRQRAFDLLGRAIADGSTMREFARALADDEVSLGITPSDTGYLANVFRTNTASAYGAGRYEQITGDVVRAARPLVQYRTSRDSRVRPNHAALEGVVFDQQNDPTWGRYAPPLGYQCRCVIVTLRELPAGATVTDSSTLTVQPDPGWNAAPT